MIAVKDNQPKLHGPIPQMAQIKAPVSRHVETETTRRDMDMLKDFKLMILTNSSLWSEIALPRIGESEGRSAKQRSEIPQLSSR